ncbi:MAG: tail fiber domain-containing protein [Patescibacteria group bacterium]
MPAGTTSLVASLYVDEPNLTATGTVTDAASLYIAGAATEGSSGNYALWVDSGATQLDGALTLGTTGTDGNLTIYSEQGSTDYSVVLQPNSSMTQTTTYTLPADDGSSNQVLASDGSGNLSWINVSAGAGNSWSTTGSSPDVTYLTDLTSDFALGAIGTTAPLYFDESASALTLNPYGTGTGNVGEIRMTELIANGTNYTGFKAPDTLGADYIYTLPTDDGEADQVLASNGSGNLDWIDISAGAGGLWIDGGDYVYIAGTYASYIGNTAADGANKLAGAFFEDDASLVLGSTNDFTLAYDATTDNRLELSANNQEFSIDLGNQDLVLAGSAEGTAALTLTAGDLTVTDGDLTISSGETSFATNSTADTSKALTVSHSGNITGTGYGIYSTVTGTSTANIAGYFNSSGATSNYGLLADAATGDIVGSAANAGDLLLISTTDSTKGDIQFHSSSYYVNSSGQMILNTDETLNGIDVNSGAISDVTQLTLNNNDPSIIFDVTTATDTDFWLGVQDDAGGDDDDKFMIGDGATPGTNSFLTIDTSGQVGIGTTSPTTDLQISDGSSVNMWLDPQAASHSNPFFAMNNVSSNRLQMFFHDGASTNNWARGFVLQSYVAGRGMTFAIPNSSDFRITASNTGNSATTDPIVFLVNNSGDVGIGNSSPSYRLDVNSSTTDEVARFLSSDDLAQILISDDDTTGYLAAKDSTLSIGLTSGLSTSNINIDTSGNVGIGTTAPSQELTVYNDTVIGGSTSLTETLDNSGFSLGGDDLFVAGTAGIEGDVYTDGSFIAGSTLTLNDAYIRDSADLNLQADGDTDDYIILDTTSNEAAILFENATKAYTNDPGIKINGTTGKLEYRDEDESTWTAIDTVIPFTNSASPDVTYLTDTTEYLGIGLTSPGYSLEVNHATDDILAEFESGDALAGIQITDSSDTAYLLTQDATLSLGMTNSLSSSNLNIDSSGQVGIGVTNPLSTLNVYSASGSDVTFSLDDGDVANPFTTIANYTANQFFVVDPLSSTDGGAKVTGASDGDAIGLKLRGLIGSDTVSNHIPAVQILGGRHDGAGDIQGLATGDIIFQVTENGGDGSFFNIQGNGDVGIGTTNPTTPLHVYDSDGGHAVKLDVGSGNAWLEFSEAGTQRWVMGNNSTQSDRFYVLDQDNNQGVYMAQNTTAWVANSDSRLKENISTENNILDKVSQMRAVSYNFIGNNPSKKEIGVIAQEIEPYFPEVVDTDAEYWGVSYSRLGAIALGGLKEQYELFQDQQNQVNILSTDLNSQLSTHDTQLSDIANQLVTQDERLTTNESLITTLETNLSAIEEELTTNRLAIGTTASSELAMAVEQANIDTAIALLSNSDASASADVLELQVGATIAGLDNAFVTFKNGLGDVIGKITGNETGGVTYSTSGADFAEYFPKVNPDEKLEPGDIVCLHSLGGIKKCGNSSLSGEANIIGVVSEHAGFVGNSEHADNPNYALVGILGQLPVKISTDANIQPGDAITIGSDGKAIKATSAGYIVGKALEKPLLSGSAEDGDQIFSPKGESTVLTYINPSYYIGDLTANGTLTSSHDFSSPPDGEELESESLQSEDARGEADLFTRLENSLKTSLGESVDENKISDLETELSELKEQIAMITEKITEETELPDNRMLIGDTVVEVDAYGEVLGTSSTDQPSLDLEDLPADRQGKFEFFETLAEKNQIGETESAINETETLELNSESNITLLAELFKIDEDGNIAVAGNLDVEGSVSTQKLQISESSPEPSPDLEGKTENTSLGSATLAAGETSVLVKTTALSENSKIFTSLTSESGNQSLIVKIHDDSSFKVSIENKHSENITFDWWIVDAIKKTNKTLEEGLRLASPSAGINY